MKAAVVHEFMDPPGYADYPSPKAGTDEVLVRVSASALSQLVRAQASGKHYSSGRPPLVPGVDGVGYLEDGRRVYFAFPRMPYGAMAQQTVVNSANWVEVPDALEDVTIAAIANPGMSSWVALTERAKLRTGEAVLINGAAGASGRLAIRIARYLGAGKIIATARNPDCFPDLLSLGADQVIPLELPITGLKVLFREAIHDQHASIVLDYLWGASAEAFLQVAGEYAGARAQPHIRFVQIGSMAGTNITLAGASLRSSRLELLGSGLGSVSHTDIVAAAAQVFQAIGAARLSIDTESFDLAQVQQVWGHKTNSRIVFKIAREPA
ncbi:MAG: zinc-binding alcohol dehydrogenase family protein [Gammaproteobacteria bacterium]|nr:zinc-binding alcohol dehydrogenase family protein [Gammaproteobacteria bacterium]MBP6050849.1 zinc-binding alcohol dehydrogenase family protein [Pseudomonadales bacterium]MBK6584363.1 zinc-binding alcohol dehydrogenase family protein [Gammaproteobacteria bacterium]MBK7168396.1 zinc-binding alcohol dehydrogenase family protein [Gammaproteobacteria bacterium]MBK7520823.1 zinc-binding alcohol dehydrogenase family protein [Gammaproteobacteria bacterium]